jgi:3-oxoacyl-[acyl-carrier-protein] synthase II
MPAEYTGALSNGPADENGRWPRRPVELLLQVIGMGSNSRRRVVITGVGLISPLGNSKQSFWDALVNGQSGVGPLTSVPTEHLPTKYAAEARQFTGHIREFGDLPPDQKKAIRKRLSVMCREMRMGVAAAQLALQDAGLGPGTYDPDRTGVIYGADYMLTVPEEFVDGITHCIDENRQFQFSRWGQSGLPRVAPLWLLKYLPNLPACYIAIYNDLRGPNNSITIRETSGNLALGEAFHVVQRGSADVIIAGATGTRVHPIRTIHVAMQEELAEDRSDPAAMSRPFDRDRTGMVIGEAASALVLEDLDTAQRRGANILGEIVGHGSSTVVDRDFVAWVDRALENAIGQALQEADIRPEDIGHIHAHGLSTRQGDIEEARALSRVFQDRAANVPLVAAKSHFGNVGASGGTLELIASLLAFEHRRLFPVLNYQTPDPQCPVAAVTTNDVPPGDSFVNLSYAPTGQASAVVVRAFK